MMMGVCVGQLHHHCEQRLADDYRNRGSFTNCVCACAGEFMRARACFVFACAQCMCAIVCACVCMCVYVCVRTVANGPYDEGLFIVQIAQEQCPIHAGVKNPPQEHQAHHGGVCFGP